MGKWFGGVSIGGLMRKDKVLRKIFRIQNHLRKIGAKVVRTKKLMRGLRKEILK